MVLTFTSPASRNAAAGRFVAGQAAVAVSAILVSLLAVPLAGALAQQPPIHYFNRGGLPPGAIGSQQLLRGGPLPGYFQPVEVEAPEGASISLAVQGQFAHSQEGSVKAGLLIGQVYHFRVTGIHRNQGFEVYPSVEVINRLYPPPGQEARFPIPIQLTLEELGLALEGKFVTRVIYLENPNVALPVREDPQHRRYFEVHPNDDPLEVADRLGRPMAILRMGSRVPDRSDSSYSLGDRGAPLLLFPPEAQPSAEQPAEAAPKPAEPPAEPAAPQAARTKRTAAPSLASRVFKLSRDEPTEARGKR